MKRPELIDLTLKITGIIMVIQLVNSVIQLIFTIPQITFIWQGPDDGQFSYVIALFGIYVLGPLIYAVVIYQLTSKSDKWARRILRPHQMEEEINLKIEPQVMLNVSILIASIFLLFWNIPTLLMAFGQFIASNTPRHMDYMPVDFDKNGLIEPILNIAVALILFTWSSPISHYLANRIVKATPSEEQEQPKIDDI
ncbi:MAG TPA: hypothetical protein PKC38_11785 [Chitinophagales bacterium]|nr:hypothetical protein [Chitinophagales bacterium]